MNIRVVFLCCSILLVVARVCRGEFLTSEMMSALAAGVTFLSHHLNDTVLPRKSLNPCTTVSRFAHGILSRRELISKLKPSLQSNFRKALVRLSQVGVVCSLTDSECEGILMMFNLNSLHKRVKRRARRYRRRRKFRNRAGYGFQSEQRPGGDYYYVIPVPIPPCHYYHPPEPPPAPPSPPAPTPPDVYTEPPPVETQSPYITESTTTKSSIIICVPCMMSYAPCKPSCPQRSYGSGGGAPSYVPASYGSGSKFEPYGSGPSPPYVPASQAASYGSRPSTSYDGPSQSASYPSYIPAYGLSSGSSYGAVHPPASVPSKPYSFPGSVAIYGDSAKANPYPSGSSSSSMSSYHPSGGSSYSDSQSNVLYDAADNSIGSHSS